MSQKTKAEIIQETYEAYLDPNNRGVWHMTFGEEFDNEVCCYLTTDGKMCAVGRCIREDVDRKGLTGSVPSIPVIFDTPLDDLLKEEYRGHEPEFWEALQSFHDNHTNFKFDEPVGYTEKGLKQLERLKETWIK